MEKEEEGWYHNRKKKAKKTTDKKVRFEDAKKLLGGAIRGDVRKAPSATPAIPSTFDSVMQQAQMLKGSPAMTESLHGVVNLNFTNDLAMFQYEPAFQAESEVDLHRDLQKLTTGRGMRHDHPLVAKTIMESLKHLPKLQHLYATG